MQELLKMSIACNILERYIHKFQVEISFVYCPPEEEFLSNFRNKAVEKKMIVETLIAQW